MYMFVYWKIKNDQGIQCNNKAYSSVETGTVILAEVKVQRDHKESKPVPRARVMSVFFSSRLPGLFDLPLESHRNALLLFLGHSLAKRLA